MPKRKGPRDDRRPVDGSIYLCRTVRRQARCELCMTRGLVLWHDRALAFNPGDPFLTLHIQLTGLGEWAQ